MAEKHVTKVSLRHKKQDLLTKIYEGFLQNSSNDSTLRIVAKLVHHNCLQYNQKCLIIDQNLNNNERADKLFDYVYRSDVNVIDVFLSEVKEIFPYLYRKIGVVNKEINSEHRLSYYVGSIPCVEASETTKREKTNKLLNELDNDKLDLILVDLAEIHAIKDNIRMLKDDKIKGIEEKLNEILTLLKENKVCSRSEYASDCNLSNDYATIENVSERENSTSTLDHFKAQPIIKPNNDSSLNINIKIDLNQTLSKAAKNVKGLFRHKTFSCTQSDLDTMSIGKYTRLSKKQKQAVVNEYTSLNNILKKPEKLGDYLEAIQDEHEENEFTHL